MCIGNALCSGVVKMHFPCCKPQLTRRRPKTIHVARHPAEPHGQTGPENVVARANAMGVAMLNITPSGSIWAKRFRMEICGASECDGVQTVARSKAIPTSGRLRKNAHRHVMASFSAKALPIGPPTTRPIAQVELIMATIFGLSAAVAKQEMYERFLLMSGHIVRRCGCHLRLLHDRTTPAHDEASDNHSIEALRCP